MRLIRTHRSTKLIAAILLALVVLLNWPGLIASLSGKIFGGGYTVAYEHGWPIVCWYRTVHYDPTAGPTDPKWGIPSLAWDSWEFWEATRGSFRPLAFLADIVAGLTLVVGIPAIWEAWRRQRNHFYRFRIIDLLVFCALVAGVLGWCAQSRHQFAREKTHVDALDAD